VGGVISEERREATRLYLNGMEMIIRSKTEEEKGNGILLKGYEQQKKKRRKKKLKVILAVAPVKTSRKGTDPHDGTEMQ